MPMIHYYYTSTTIYLLGSTFQLIKYNLLKLGLYLLMKKLKICRLLIAMIRKLCYPEISMDSSGDSMFYNLFQSYFEMFQPSLSSSPLKLSIYNESIISNSLLLLQQLILE